MKRAVLCNILPDASYVNVLILQWRFLDALRPYFGSQLLLNPGVLPLN